MEGASLTHGARPRRAKLGELPISAAAALSFAPISRQTAEPGRVRRPAPSPEPPPPEPATVAADRREKA